MGTSTKLPEKKFLDCSTSKLPIRLQKKNWVAVKELKLSYHNGYIELVSNRVPPI